MTTPEIPKLKLGDIALPRYERGLLNQPDTSSLFLKYAPTSAAEPDATFVDLNLTNPRPPENMLAFKYGIPQEFAKDIVNVSSEINCNPEDLTALMKLESNLNPAKGKSRVGLIQFGENTAKNLGTSTGKLRKMTPKEQLEYVKKYFLQNKAEAKIPQDKELSAGELYGLAFAPYKLSKEALCKKGEKCYDGNSKLDLNHDGKITQDDLARILSSIEQENTFK